MGETRRTFSGVIGGLVGFVAMSAVAGVLVAVGITPALAVSSLAASSTINAFENLPNYLKIDELSQVSTIYALQGNGEPYALASFYDQNRVEVPLEAMNQFVQDAVVAGEDPRFREHGGVDLQGTLRATLARFTGGPTSGGSSVTQQYVKNVLVQKCEVMPDPDELQACFEEATDPTEERKLKEMRLAIGVEKEYSKDQILQGYLNITGFGGTVYGIQAASEYYYSATAATITLPQAASLVAIVNNPEKFRLDVPESETNGAANGYAANKDRRDYILSEMLRYNKINQADYDAAIASPIEPAISEPSTGCQTAGGAAYFCDYVTYQLKTDPTFGEDEESRLTNFRRGGYEIYTTLDIELQMASEATIAANVPQTYPGWDVGAVATSVQVGTGRVLTMAQNKLYTQLEESPGPEYTGINYNTDFAQGGSLGFQPASTYKVFTLAEWLQEGHPLGERVDSARKSSWGTFQDYCDGPQSFGDYDPKNDANESGRNYSALESTIDSINTGFLGMAKRLDLCKIRDTAEAFGVHRANGDPLQKGASSVLGTNEIAPLTMAVAFAGIANKGTTCSPIVIDRIIGADGAEIAPPVSTCTQSVEPEVAAGMAYAMERVLTQGSGGQSYRNTSPRVPLIGKTGTAEGSKDTWMSGASTKVATVVGVVSVTGDANQRRIDFASGEAATARHRMWPDIMGVANAKYGGDEFDQASSNLIRGRQVTVPDVRGLSVGEARNTLESDGFGFLDGGQTDSELPAGTVAGSNPAGGNSTSTGTTVTVYSSNGSQILLPDVVGQSLPQAKGTLSGFGVVANDQAVTDKKQDGKVLSQNPAPGSPAIPGGTVIVVVGKFG